MWPYTGINTSTLGFFLSVEVCLFIIKVQNKGVSTEWLLCNIDALSTLLYISTNFTNSFQGLSKWFRFEKPRLYCLIVPSFSETLISLALHVCYPVTHNGAFAKQISCEQHRAEGGSIHNQVFNKQSIYQSNMSNSHNYCLQYITTCIYYFRLTTKHGKCIQTLSLKPTPNLGKNNLHSFK